MGTTSHFATPNPPCATCAHFGHWIYVPSTAWCEHPRAPHVRSQAEHGCVYWEREVGADDESLTAYAPTPLPRLGPG